MNAIPAVAVAIFKDNNVLLVKHKEKAGHLTGTYGLPAGRNEEGESNIVAAIRELEEETGLVAIEEDMIEYPQNAYTADLSRKDGSTIRATMTVFICRKYTGELRESDETEPMWVDVEDALTYALLPNVANAMRDALHFLKKEGK